MHTLQISTFGDPAEVVELVEAPELGDPKANEALVAVEYSPINNSDLLTIRGRYGVRPALPSGLGNEGVGRVLAVGAGDAASNGPVSPATRC